jgi:hypothetical protein
MDVDGRMSAPIVVTRATAFLQQFVDPARQAERAALVASLRPTPEDYAALFVPDAAEKARAGYEAALWSHPPPWPIRPEQTLVVVRAAVTAEALIAGEPDASMLPGGYRHIASSLRPGSLWLAWEFLAPGASAGLYFDGLVPRDHDRFVWLPKPWRILGG